MTPISKYRPSGSFGLSTLALAIAGIIAAALLAWPYTALLRWIPFIQLNFITTAAFAAALLGLSWYAATQGQCRSRAVAAIAGLLIGVSGLAASYGWAYQHFLGEVAEDEAFMAEHPGATFAQLAEMVPFTAWARSRVEHGWKVSGEGDEKSGAIVLCVWAIEALMLLGAAIYGGVHAAARPFCERCRAWTTERVLLLHGHSRATAKPLIESGDLDALLALRELAPAERPPAAGTEKDPHLGLKLAGAVCATCREGAWLTVKELRTAIIKGKIGTKEKPVLAQAMLDPAQTAKFLERVPALPLAAVG